MALSFKRRYINLIVLGEKTATRRMKRPWLREGGLYPIRVGFHNLGEYIRVKKIYRQRLGELTEEDLAKEGMNSLEEFKEEWRRIYRFWDDGFMAWVIEFEYVGRPPGGDRKI